MGAIEKSFLKNYLFESSYAPSSLIVCSLYFSNYHKIEIVNCRGVRVC